MTTLQTLQTADITPSPRILWVLGQIPFRPWQALAELIDNSLDAFLAAEREGALPDNARIDVNWSNSNVAAEKRVIEISDNGRGIDLETVTLAVRAGYTSNDPVGNLGLFGMGFNIATAMDVSKPPYPECTNDRMTCWRDGLCYNDCRKDQAHPPQPDAALVDALREAREALHFHYTEWDGEPEDAVPLQLARDRIDAILAGKG